MSNSARNIALVMIAVVAVSLAIGAFVGSREPELDPAKADYARSACRTFFDLAVASGATEDPEQFGEEAARNAAFEGRITDEEREPFAAACADGAAAAKDDGIDPGTGEAAEIFDEFGKLFEPMP